MILGYEDNSFFERVVEIYRLMEIKGILVDEIIIVSIIVVCVLLSFLDMGMKFYELVERIGYISYVIVVNILIDLYFRCKCIDKVLEIFY